MKLLAIILAVVALLLFIVFVAWGAAIERRAAEVEHLRGILYGSSLLDFPTLAKAAAPLAVLLRDRENAHLFAVVRRDRVDIFDDREVAPVEQQSLKP